MTLDMSVPVFLRAEMVLPPFYLHLPEQGESEAFHPFVSVC